MTLAEFSDEFDVQLASYLRFKKFDSKEILDSIEVNEYEKSVYLTKAQNELTIELYTGRNNLGGAFEETEELRRYLADLNTTEIITNFTKINSGISESSYEATITKPVLFITYESCLVTTNDECYQSKYIDCKVIKRDEYNVIKDNPFKNNKVWRVDHSTNIVELITKHRLKEYKVSFLTTPTPIILEDISPLKINGISTPTEAVLNPILHDYILERAVTNAIRDLARLAPNTDN